MKNGFMTPPEHVNFEAKKLFENIGRIIDGSVACIGLNGGGLRNRTRMSMIICLLS